MANVAPGQPAAVVYECDCALLANDVLMKRRHCLHRDGGAYRLDPAAIAAFGLPDDTTTFEVSSSCGIFHARRDGRALPTHLFDNGADYFCSGLARYVLDGKYGYMNRSLDVVVAPRYDFSFPFDGERGAVCNDCTSHRTGEYTVISCSHCGAVDKSGALVLPLELSSQDFFTRYPAGECD